MGKILLLGDRYTVSLFKMMGTEGEVIEDPFNLEKELDTIKKERGCGSGPNNKGHLRAS